MSVARRDALRWSEYRDHVSSRGARLPDGLDRSSESSAPHAPAPHRTSSSHPQRRVVNRTGRPPSTREHLHAFQHSIAAVDRCPYPVVAAAHSIALGLSIDIMSASASDVRYAASIAVFAIEERPAPAPLPDPEPAGTPRAFGHPRCATSAASTARGTSCP
ncbi:hypothetical protein POSPLADRAFT_1059148 [Postia placenta MAD-698-R-SB12]|uniref:Uncharacterized protein n=1 Tax=Postia placenta MAD-698-R-SB12 TaxID=670580 RepID=A0A1X6MUC9_9APHY|nr:hypothetical protein POSPLADRAFT_1059148 [Postia placenta MAD-698-R-SB12]OSX59860.1 hypothetical protein POSPLADRAFT_1059148 [Postia placenta MAD-698-R-SB12]